MRTVLTRWRTLSLNWQSAEDVEDDGLFENDAFAVGNQERKIYKAAVKGSGNLGDWTHSLHRQTWLTPPPWNQFIDVSGWGAALKHTVWSFYPGQATWFIRNPWKRQVYQGHIWNAGIEPAGLLRALWKTSTSLDTWHLKRAVQAGKKGNDERPEVRNGFKGKTSSQRLRSVLFVNGSRTRRGFDTSVKHYEHYMEKIINHYKGKTPWLTMEIPIPTNNSDKRNWASLLKNQPSKPGIKPMSKKMQVAKRCTGKWWKKCCQRTTAARSSHWDCTGKAQGLNHKQKRSMKNLTQKDNLERALQRL